MSLKEKISVRLGRPFTRHRDSWPVRRLSRFARWVWLLCQNNDYDSETNGEAAVLRLLQAQGPLRTVVDIGANVGAYAQLVLQAAPSATIYCYEPIESTYAELVRHLRSDSRVRAFNCGLGAEDKEVEFLTHPSISTLSSAVGIAQMIHSDTLTVPVKAKVRQAAAALREAGIQHVDFLKIDTEGYDYFVLEGLRDYLAAGAVDCIQFEYGYANIGTRRLLLDYYELLTGFGFQVGKIYPHRVDFRPYRLSDEDFVGPNFLAVHSGRADLIAALRRA